MIWVSQGANSYFCKMFVRQKKNKSGVVSIQVIDKSSGKYKVLKTVGSSTNPFDIQNLIEKGSAFIKNHTGAQELDFTNTNSVIQLVLNNITSHKLIGIDLVLGKIFDDIGFNKIQDKFFRFGFVSVSLSEKQTKNSGVLVQVCWESLLGRRYLKIFRQTIQDAERTSLAD